MNRSRISWLVNADGTQGYTWSPMSGCGPGLPCYERCWARAYHVRYRGGDFGVKMHPEKLDATKECVEQAQHAGRFLMRAQKAESALATARAEVERMRWALRKIAADGHEDRCATQSFRRGIGATCTCVVADAQAAFSPSPAQATEGKEVDATEVARAVLRAFNGGCAGFDDMTKGPGRIAAVEAARAVLAGRK